MGQSQVSFIERRQLADMYEYGFTIPEIRELSGYSAGGIHHWIKDLVTIRPWATRGELSNLFRGGSRRDKRALREYYNALKTGKIKAPTNCDDCGESKRRRDGRSGIQAHHCDYNKPMDVMWLCQKCHTKWHRSNEAIPFSGEEFPTFVKQRKDRPPKQERVVRLCTVEGCSNKHKSLGFCASHLQSYRFRRLSDGDSPPNRQCGVDGCRERHYAKGLCCHHYQSERLRKMKLSLDK